MHRVTRSSAARLRTFFRLRTVLTRSRVPSQSTETGLVDRRPSGRIVVMNAIGVPSRSSRTWGEMGTGPDPLVSLTGASCWTRRRSHQNQRVSTGLVVAVAMALAFAFTNGVHDAA